MRIAIVGAGIAGLGSAWLLQKQGHAVTLFEGNDYLGGHTHTVDITLEGVTAPVDTGFLVFNDRTYPKLDALFDELGVDSVASEMTFSARIDAARARVGGDEPRLAVRAAVERACARISGACSPTSCASTARRSAHARSRYDLVDLARRVPRRAPFRHAVSRLVPAADGRGNLVVAEARDPRFSAADIRPVLPQPRTALDRRPPAMADRRRRRARVRREDRRRACRRAPRDAGHAYPPRRARRRRRGRREPRALRRGRARVPRRPGAPAPRRPDDRRARPACRDPLPAEPGRPAHGHRASSAIAPRVGGVELSRRTRRATGRDPSR